MYKYKIAREEIFLGTVEDFRALMYGIFLLQPDFKPDQIFLQGERTPPDYPQKSMARWEITLGGSFEQRGYIIACQLTNGTTKLQFAYFDKFKSIGTPFHVEYADMILQSASGEFTLSKTVASNLTSIQKEAIKSLVDLGRSWREEFVIIWHDPDEISDILDYDFTPPQVSRGTIRALEREGLLTCDYLNNSKMRVTLATKAYQVVDSDFKTPDTAPKIVSILFLAADPTDQTRLRLGEESREIQEKLQMSKERERFNFVQRMSLRPADISQALLDIQPQIVHFSGHGTSSGALCFENQMGQTHPVQPEALASLFEQFKNQVKCVILNACYSESQANSIAKHIDYVIGMNQGIGDKAAIAFAIGFYQALGGGRTIEVAFKLGCAQIGLQGFPEHLIPIIIRKRQQDFAEQVHKEQNKPKGTLYRLNVNNTKSSPKRWQDK